MQTTDVPPPQDGRGYWVLPQGSEEGGFYNYGTPAHGAGQYCHPTLLNLIFMVGFGWAKIDDRRFGIGNISLAGGAKFEKHLSHRDGLQMDIRALRKDGQPLPVTYRDKEYDRNGTARLLNCFFETGLVKKVFFNDLTIPMVVYAVTHDNHFHVAVR